jgi:hypothetical protein
MDKKFFAIGASGCPLAPMAVQYCKPLLTFEIGGVFSHSSTASLVVNGVLKLSKLSKYLLRDEVAYADQNELLVDEKRIGSCYRDRHILNWNPWLVVGVPLFSQHVFGSGYPFTGPSSFVEI